MPGRLQIAAAMIAVSAVAALPAFAQEAVELPGVDFDIAPSAVERPTSAGATMRVRKGWSATLFVSYLGPRRTPNESSSLLIRPTTFVNARLGRNLTKNTRVTFDVFNVFDQHLGNIDYLAATQAWNPSGIGDNYLFNPVEPRGFRIRLRTTF